MNVTPGQKIGRFLLLEHLASTGLATLYRAQDPDTGRPVVIKLFHAYFSEEPALLDTYFDQVRRAAALRHPNILAATDSGRNGSPWIAMEYAPGGSLQDSVGKAIAIGEVARIASDVAAALDAAHAHGLRHGDLKPANVFRGAAGGYRLADFGMAVLGRSAHLLMRSTSRTPLPAYMAPEQAMNLTVTERSDVYALGVLAYHLLTGRVPFPGLDTATVSARQAGGPPLRPDAIEPSVPAAVAEVVLKALAMHPERRYASAGQLAEAFRQAVESTGSSGVVVLQRPAALDASSGRPAASASPAPSSRRAPSAPPPIPAAAERLYCHVCGYLNELNAAHCEKCWAALEPGAVVDEAAMTALVRRRARRDRLARAAAVAALALALFVGLVAYLNARGIPKPLSSVTAASAPGEWAMHHANPSHTGFAPGPAPPLQGQVRWQFTTTGRLFADPLVAGGLVYLAAGDRRLVALDAASGAVRWEAPLEGVPYGAPALAGPLLYLGLADGRLLALERETGRQRWTFRSGGPIYAPPAVKDGLVYVATGRGTFHAVDALTGQEAWDFTVGEWINAAPAVSDDGTVIFGARDGNVYLLDARTGKSRLRFRSVTPVEAGAAIAGDVAYVPTDAGSIIAIDLTERRRLFDRQITRIRNQLFVWNIVGDPAKPRGFIWSAPVGRRAGVPSTPAVAHGLVYAASRDGQLVAMDQRTGQQRWAATVGRTSASSPTVVGDTLYIGTDAGKLYGFDALTGQRRWEWSAFPGGQITTSAIVSGDTLFIAASLERVEIDVFQVSGGAVAGPRGPLADGWYYRYHATPCTPLTTSPTSSTSPFSSTTSAPQGPFADRQQAETQGRLSAPACGVLYALR